MSDAPQMTSSVTWTDGMAFDAGLDGFDFGLDADEQFGGQGRGPKPKGLVLTALVGCTGMDVISMLKKMKIAPKLTRFHVEAKAGLTDTHPKVFDRVDLVYYFEGEDLPLDRLKRAVKLSQEKYCGVAAMLRPVVQLSRAIWVNGELNCEQEDAAPIATPG